MSPEQEYGEQWEIRLVKKLLEFGQVERLSEYDWTSEFDIKLNDKLIHCKAAQSKRHRAEKNRWRNRYQFNFSMVTDGDFIIAICDTWGEPVYFIIPVSELQKRGLYITSHPLTYSGWAAEYRERWELLHG